MLGATNLIPGPNSTEMAIHIGHRRAGWKGLIVGGACFILPAMLIVTACAWVYTRFGSLPDVQGVMYGVKPVIIAVVLQALWRLGRAAGKDWPLAILALIATAVALAGANLLAILFGAGILAALRESIRSDRAPRTLAAILPAIRSPLAATSAAAAAVSITMSGLFLLFLKFGAIVYGSGYVLLAFLQFDLVDRLHWLTQAQLLDAVAIGQVTPGPVFTTATFIGYLLGGLKGAIVATVAIFLPGFVLVAASRPLIPRIRRSKIAAAFLDGVNVGAVALMVAVTWQLSRAALVDGLTAGIGAASAAALIFSRISSVWLIFAGGLIGLIASVWSG